MLRFPALALIGGVFGFWALQSGGAAAAPDWEPYAGQGTETYPQAVWTKAERPEDLGWSAEGLREAQGFSERIGTTALVVAKGGVVVAAWGALDRKINVYSVRKSLLSALYGIAVAKGRIDLTSNLEQLGIDDRAPGLTAAEKQATVADLITARSGIYLPALYESPGVSAGKPARGSHKPGSRWLYNNWDFNALGTIYEQQAGRGLFEAFAQELAAPLRMEDFSAADGEYVTGPQSQHPAYPFHMTARDLARFALLYLRRGRWEDRQIVPEAWVDLSTQRHSAVGPEKGYGYMWWSGRGGGLLANLQVAQESFYASGLGGQFAFVFPHLDLVIVHLVDKSAGGRLPGNGQIGHLVWQILEAGGLQGHGPDPSLRGAAGQRLFRADLETLLPGKTILGGLGGHAWAASVRADGSLEGIAGEDESDRDSGAWRLDGDRYCRKWQTWAAGRERCYDLVLEGSNLLGFDDTGTLSTRMRIE